MTTSLTLDPALYLKEARKVKAAIGPMNCKYCSLPVGVGSGGSIIHQGRQMDCQNNNLSHSSCFYRQKMGLNHSRLPTSRSVFIANGTLACLRTPRGEAGAEFG